MIENALFIEANIWWRSLLRSGTEASNLYEEGPKSLYSEASYGMLAFPIFIQPCIPLGVGEKQFFYPLQIYTPLLWGLKTLMYEWNPVALVSIGWAGDLSDLFLFWMSRGIQNLRWLAQGGGSRKMSTLLCCKQVNKGGGGQNLLKLFNVIFPQGGIHKLSLQARRREG